MWVDTSYHTCIHTVLKYLLISSRLPRAAPKLSSHKQNPAILFSSERQIRTKATLNKVLGTVHCQYTSYGKGAYVTVVHPL